MARNNEDLVVGLDVGTTKVCAIVGEVTDHGIDIMGMGTQPSKGLKKGMVVNIEDTVNSIRRAIEEAENMAGCTIQTVYTGIAGGHIKGFNASGKIAVRGGEVKLADVHRAVGAAQVFSLTADREVIHVIPQQYVVDNQDGIKDPEGMSGTCLEAKVHVVTANVAAAQNIVKCANRTGLNVADIVLQPLASAEAVLTEDEKELGVALVDIGGGTTDIAIYLAGSVVHTSVMLVGGNHLTQDISIGLRSPQHEAEELKKKYGCALTSMVQPQETIEVPCVGGRKPRVHPRQVLCQILEPRVEEIFQFVRDDLERSGYDEQLAAGMVITGGSTQLPGMVELAEDTTGLPVRRGAPHNGIGGLVDVVKNPMYATGVGLVLFGARYGAGGGRKPLFRIRDNNIYDRILSRMRRWFRSDR